ncbi:hypothetical protein SORBI_3002G197650 [Sorghum bicolor]|jgi:hypothetical protein|uniref:Uncharacterized protein n=1 Tax=Sorghum bicolor TaxID=4558 RepID=A0A1W0W554_SORBI|nr:hypothetical protein SORBI_3002G197650 [Sorghum bicolor]
MSAIAASAPRHGICGLVVHVLLFGAPAKLPLAMWPVGLYKKKKKKICTVGGALDLFRFWFFLGDKKILLDTTGTANVFDSSCHVSVCAHALHRRPRTLFFCLRAFPSPVLTRPSHPALLSSPRTREYRQRDARARTFVGDDKKLVLGFLTGTCVSLDTPYADRV